MGTETHQEYKARINSFVPKQLSDRDVNSLSFKWFVKGKKEADNKMVQLKNLSTNRLNYITRFIERCEGNEFAYRPKVAWLNAIKKELKYRNSVGSKALDIVPKLKKKINRMVFLVS
jgi:hypothetical protein